jgi:hypothetical protein
MFIVKAWPRRATSELGLISFTAEDAMDKDRKRVEERKEKKREKEERKRKRGKREKDK